MTYRHLNKYHNVFSIYHAVLARTVCPTCWPKNLLAAANQRVTKSGTGIFFEIEEKHTTGVIIISTLQKN